MTPRSDADLIRKAETLLHLFTWGDEPWGPPMNALCVALRLSLAREQQLWEALEALRAASDREFNPTGAFLAEAQARADEALAAGRQENNG